MCVFTPLPTFAPFLMKNVAYYRVSTQQQGDSRLGLEAQQLTVFNFIQSDNGLLIAEFTEIESGKNNSRAQLQVAIQFAKTNAAKLIIAKLDRLSRNVGFIFALRDAKVDFLCCDIPEANTLTIGIFAVLAQHERELISKRTKEALHAKKLRGETWDRKGAQTLCINACTAKSVAVRKRKAVENENNRKATELIKALRPQGLSFQKIANQLNGTGFETSTGKHFTAKTVQLLWLRSLNGI